MSKTKISSFEKPGRRGRRGPPGAMGPMGLSAPASYLGLPISDQELEAMVISFKQIDPLHFDAQWRVLNYLLTRLWGRSWTLSKPKGDV